MTAFGLYAQAKEYLAVAALEPHFHADTTALPAFRPDEWATWARRGRDARATSIVDIHTGLDRAPVAGVTRVKAGPVRWLSTSPRT